MTPARSEDKILSAALALMAENGVDGLTVEAVAARAGVGKQTIYRHWGSRATLVHDAISRIAGPIRDVDTGSVRGDLDGLLGRLDQFLSNPATGRIFPSLIDAAERDPELGTLRAEHAAANRAAMAAAIERGIARGELAANLDIDAAIALLAGPVFYRRLINRALPDGDDFLTRHLDLALTALRPVAVGTGG